MKHATTNDDLRTRREALGLTLTDLAAKIGVSAGALCHWERGTRIPRPLYRQRWIMVLARLEKRYA